MPAKKISSMTGFLLSVFSLVFGATPIAVAQNTHAPAPNIESVAVTREVRLSREPRISDFTGLPVPRFGSLRYSRVNGRAGPGEDYPVQWTYERSGLPVMVVRESTDWIKIRDPEGDEVWVAKRMVGQRRTGITAANTQIHKSPDSLSRIVADVDVGVVADLAACDGRWCQVQIAGHKGWIHRDVIWGADDLG